MSLLAAENGDQCHFKVATDVHFLHTEAGPLASWPTKLPKLVQHSASGAGHQSAKVPSVARPAIVPSFSKLDMKQVKDSAFISSHLPTVNNCLWEHGLTSVMSDGLSSLPMH
jgi:hypothetical protein